MKISSARALVTGGASGLGEGTVRMIAAAGGKATIKMNVVSERTGDCAK